MGYTPGWFCQILSSPDRKKVWKIGGSEKGTKRDKDNLLVLLTPGIKILKELWRGFASFSSTADCTCNSLFWPKRWIFKSQNLPISHFYVYHFLVRTVQKKNILYFFCPLKHEKVNLKSRILQKNCKTFRTAKHGPFHPDSGKLTFVAFSMFLILLGTNLWLLHIIFLPKSRRAIGPLHSLFRRPCWETLTHKSFPFSDWAASIIWLQFGKSFLP